MTSISTSEGDGSWLKKRSTLFNTNLPNLNSPTNANTTAKVVDQELARLKKKGAVSSVWSNKFVQEDTGGTTDKKAGSMSPSGRYVNMSPRPNANYNPTTGNRSSLNSTSSSPKLNHRPSNHRLTSTSISSLDLDEARRSSQSSTEEVRLLKRSSSVDQDTLWTEYESLKNQYDQVNTLLIQANKDITYYKQQHQTESINKEQEVGRVRELAELIVKQNALLGEYEISLERLSQSTKDPSGNTTIEMKALRQELSGLYQLKNEMEKTIESLKADLEMSYSQMRLMMVVSTEIQSEFESYKQKVNAELSELMAEKDQVIEYGIATSSPDYADELEALRLEIKKLTNAIQERDRQSQAAALEHEATLAKVQEQATELEQLKAKLKDSVELCNSQKTDEEDPVQLLQSQIQDLNKKLEQKDLLISKLESQIKTQKMNMDSQMIDLTQSILEKDALLLEFMSSRNNSTNSNTLNASPAKAETAKEEVKVEDNVYNQRQNEARRQMSQVRDFMYTTSSDEEEVSEDEHAYSTDEEENTYPKKISSNLSRHERGPQSPEGTVSSFISFDSSDDEQEQIAEIKHFSYTSVLSQSTLSLHSHNSTVVNTQETTKRYSNQIIPPFSKETSATGSTSWPMPPPTPPPSEPLPPLPVLPQNTRGVKDNNTTPPPPRRGRSKTMVREESPSPYTTSIHKTSELPRIVPLQKNPIDHTLPVPPLRKDVKKSLIDSHHSTQPTHRPPANTTWMDDPESEEEHWSEALSH